MNATKARVALAAAVAASALVGATPSHADLGGGWVVIGTGEISGTPDLGGAVDTVLGLVANVGGGHGKPCVPRYSYVESGALRWTVYRNDYTLAIAVVWNGPGGAAVSDDCADKLSLSVQVNDTAASGNQPVAQGDPGNATDDTPSGGEFDTYAESNDWVMYYDPPNLYVRGNSVVDLKVSASYLNPKGKVWVPLGCKETHTSIAVSWPDGQVQATSGPTENCAA